MTHPARSGIPKANKPAEEKTFPYIWFWRKRLPERKGQKCRILARGRLNSILVEFPDGYIVITSRYAVRKIDPKGFKKP
jgi:hypothetical protein